MNISTIMQSNSIYKAIIKDDIDTDELVSHYTEPNRFYHSLSKHLEPMFEEIERASNLLDPIDKEILQIVALFHDIVYKVGQPKNEEKSIQFFKSCLKSDLSGHIIHILNIISMIEDTAHYLDPDRVRTKLSDIFMSIDCKGLFFDTGLKMVENEKDLMKEFQLYPYKEYVKARLDFLRKFCDAHVSLNDRKTLQNFDERAYYLENYRPKIGIFPGSFNPFHKGHMNILEKAEKIFDKVIVAIGINPAKKDEIDWINHDITAEKLSYRQVKAYSSLLPDLLEGLSMDSCDYTVIRGIRDSSDIQHELNLIRFSQEKFPQIQFLLIPCDHQFSHISSSAIREIQFFDQQFVNNYI